MLMTDLQSIPSWAMNVDGLAMQGTKSSGKASNGIDPVLPQTPTHTHTPPPPPPTPRKPQI